GQVRIEEFRGHANTQAFQGKAAGAMLLLDGGGEFGANAAGGILYAVAHFKAGGIARVEAADGIEQFDEIPGMPGYGARLVQAGAVRNHAETRNGAIGGLYAADAAQGGGLANRTARIRTG